MEREGKQTELAKLIKKKKYYAICHKNRYVFLELQRVRRVGCPTVKELNSSVHARTTQE